MQIRHRKSIFNKLPTGVFLFLLTIQADCPASGNPVNGLLSEGTAVKKLKSSSIFAGRGDGVKTCPVTGEKITSKKLKAEMFGRTVYFCCHGCLKQAKATPDKFVKPTLAEQQQAVKALLAKAKAVNSADIDSAEFCNE